MRLSNNVLFLETSETGARIHTLQKGAKHFLFPQQMVRVDGELKLRGGMHPCSPIFGKKEIGHYATIPQHGELRDVMWQITAAHSSTGAMYHRVFKRYDYSLTYSVDYTLIQNCLRVSTVAVNNQRKLVPFEFAWHPYFNALHGAIVNIVGVTKEPLVIVGKFGPEIFPVHEEITIELPSIGTVKMFLMDGFKNSHICLWTDWKGHYVCVEPLLSHPDNFNAPSGVFLHQNQPITMKLEMDFKERG